MIAAEVHPRVPRLSRVFDFGAIGERRIVQSVGRSPVWCGRVDALISRPVFGRRVGQAGVHGTHVRCTCVQPGVGRAPILVGIGWVGIGRSCIHEAGVRRACVRWARIQRTGVR